MKRLHRPDDESKPFIARWTVLTRILLLDPSVKAVARSAMDFANFDDGASCHPGNGRVERETGLSDRAVRTAWQVLRTVGMAERVAFGSPSLRMADEYQLTVPAHWESLPVYGPHVREFHCLHCEKQFTPQGNCTMQTKKLGGALTYDLRVMAFCSPPRANRGRPQPDCFVEWNRGQGATGRPSWNDLGHDRWALFRRARGDDW